MKRIVRNLLIGAAALAATSPAMGQVIYLDFEEIAPYPNNSNVQIGEYYNGGVSSVGTSGPNLGVEFTSAATLLCLNTAGVSCSNTSRGGLGIPTSQRGALFYPGASPTMNVAAGFDTGFAGVFSAPFTAGTSISLFDGLDGAGALLASLVLGTTSGTCDPAIAGGAGYCPFENFSLSFVGTARSVVFGGTANQQVFDDLTFGSTVAGGIPEPAAWAMMILGVGAVGGALRRRAAVRVRFA